MEDEPAPAHSETDEELMRRACGTEPQRLGDLVRRHRLKLLRTAQSRLGSVAAAEDAVQETFLAAFRSRRTYNPAYTVRTWLWTILLNVCKSFWNKRLRTPQQQPWSQSADGAARSAEQPQGTPGPVEMLLEKERSERLRHALTGLRDDWADALRLRFFAEMKFQEIADVQACSLATAKNRVRWGLERLAELLRDSDGPPQPEAATSDEASTSAVPAPFRTVESVPEGSAGTEPERCEWVQGGRSRRIEAKFVDEADAESHANKPGGGRQDFRDKLLDPA